MVLGGHDHIAHAGFAGDLGPFPGRKWFGLELFGERGVFGNRNPLVLHDPLVAAHHTVESPMDEHAEASLMPPLHPALAVGVTGGRGRGSLRWGRRLRETERRIHGKGSRS